jgi:hypothetical protein
VATEIKIKRSGVAVSPTTLGAGELAYTWEGTTGGKLLIGWGDENVNGEAANIGAIGGVYYTNLLSSTAGQIANGKAVILDASSKVDSWNVDNLKLDGNTLSVTAVNTALSLSPNGTGTVTVPAGYKDRTGFGTNSLTTKEYVDAQTGALSMVITLVDDNADSDKYTTGTNLTFAGGTGLTSVVTDDTVTFNMDNTSVKYGGVSVSLGDSVAQPAFDLTNATNYPTSSLSGTITNAQLDGSIANDKLANSSVTVGTTAISLGGSSTTVAGLTQLDVDNIRIDGNTISTTDAGNTTLYLDPNPVGDSGTVVIQGDLQVRGKQTTINSEVVLIQDHALVLADSALTSAQADLAGLIIGDSTFSGRPTFLYNHSGEKWVSNKPIQVSNTAGLLFNGDSVSEIIDDRVSGLLVEGQSIGLTYTDASNTLTINADVATTSVIGVAKFDGIAESDGGSTNQFTLTSGGVRLTAIDGGTY